MNTEKSTDGLYEGKGEEPIVLTPKQKLSAIAFKYYQYAKWEPKTGDYYTTDRDDLQLYRIVEADEKVVKTKYCDPSFSTAISEWPTERFLLDFGLHRVWVPDWILKPTHPENKLPDQKGWPEGLLHVIFEQKNLEAELKSKDQEIQVAKNLIEVYSKRLVNYETEIQRLKEKSDNQADHVKDLTRRNDLTGKALDLMNLSFAQLQSENKALQDRVKELEDDNIQPPLPMTGMYPERPYPKEPERDEWTKGYMQAISDTTNKPKDQAIELLRDTVAELEKNRELLKDKIARLHSENEENKKLLLETAEYEFRKYRINAALLLEARQKWKPKNL